MKDYIYFPSSTLNTIHVEREGKTLEDTAQKKCLLAKMTKTQFMNVPAEGRWNKILLGLCVVLSNFTIQHRTGGKKPILVNNDLLFIWLIKNAFSSDWWFIYSLFQRGDNYEEFRDFFSKTIQLWPRIWFIEKVLFDPCQNNILVLFSFKSSMPLCFGEGGWSSLGMWPSLTTIPLSSLPKSLTNWSLTKLRFCQVLRLFGLGKNHHNQNNNSVLSPLKTVSMKKSARV